jgi:hypothetical protein
MVNLSFSNQPVLKAHTKCRRSAMVGYDVARHSEQPEQILRRWRYVVDTAPRHHVDLGHEVIDIVHVRSQCPTGIAVYPRDALVVEGSKTTQSLVM